jgi:hypothetical protein
MFTIAPCFRTTGAQHVYKINLATRSSPDSHCDRNTISKELQNATFILIRTHSFRGSRRVVIGMRFARVQLTSRKALLRGYLSSVLL